jgi:hypothetical protein
VNRRRREVLGEEHKSEVENNNNLLSGTKICNGRVVIGRYMPRNKNIHRKIKLLMPKLISPSHHRGGRSTQGFREDTKMSYTGAYFHVPDIYSLVLALEKKVFRMAHHSQLVFESRYGGVSHAEEDDIGVPQVVINADCRRLQSSSILRIRRRDWQMINADFNSRLRG